MSTEYWDCIRFVKTQAGKTFARQLGSAKKRDDGGFAVYLDALPPDGQFSIVPQRPRTQGGAQTKNPNDLDSDSMPF